MVKDLAQLLHKYDLRDLVGNGLEFNKAKEGQNVDSSN